ncbi:anti-anti-sigma regulatory factor [Rhodoblastus acidophilus]|uniref:STAS domain-containing protein n=1 Tax=Rhodoblastus acidophilus TaxID=1074 RepID=UPI002225B282|nr:STAS domain-containing protein [Rhodoblastus acidophilus]MCW2283284.1 anti-anti-sigma regulatory factor [Rhodoblastus acidophilus]MCW2332144.1 anti-anti-sigma regulatory factor [Rhodoblastus acidophilus]
MTTETPPMLALPPALDADAAVHLANALCDLRYAPLTLDAAPLRRIGAQGLQTLLSAARSWRADSVALTFINVSPEARDQIRAMGVDPVQEFGEAP